MRKGGRVLILLGVVLALAAAMLAVVALRDSGESEIVAETEREMVNVVRATRDIAANQVVTENDIEIVEAELETVAPNTARSAGQVIGLAAAGEIVSGQRILMANLSTPGLAHIVSEGMRAVAIPIDRVNALGGMVRADDRIDIVYSVAFDMQDIGEVLREILGDDFQQPQPQPEGEGEGEQVQQFDFSEIIGLIGAPGSQVIIQTSEGLDPATKLLLQNIRVVRVVAGDVTVDSDGQGEQEAPATNDDDDQTQIPTQTPVDRLPSVDLLIIEVDPASAELIKFIVDYEGQYQILLRGRDDEELVETGGITYRQMVEDLGLPIPLPATVPEQNEGE